MTISDDNSGGGSGGLETRSEPEITLPEPHEPDEDKTDPATPGAKQPGGRSAGFRKLAAEFEAFRTSGVRQHVDAAVGPLNQKIAELTALLAAQRQQQQEQPKPTGDGGAEEKGIITEMNALVRELRKTQDEGRYNEITERYGQLQAKLNTVRETATIARLTAEFEKKYGGQQQQNDSDPVARRAYEMIQDEYPELLTGTSEEIQKALHKVRAYVNHEVTVEDRPRTLALFKEAAAHIRAKLGKGEIPAPTRDRQTLQSQGRGQGGGGSPKNGKNGIKMPAALARAALNAVPGMTPEMLARHVADQTDD